MRAMELPLGLWWMGFGAAAAYIGMFLASSRGPALRLGRLGVLALSLAGLRAVLALNGKPLESGWDKALGILTLAGGVILIGLGRIWLIRVSGEELRAQVQDACQRLFLECQEPMAGHVVLTAKGARSDLRLWRVGSRMQSVMLPRAAGFGKVRLLLEWLSKQYAGPIQRLQISLKGSKSLKGVSPRVSPDN